MAQNNRGIGEEVIEGLQHAVSELARAEDGRQALAALAARFPSLEGSPGVRPFDAEALDAWAAGEPRGAGRYAAQFVLSVWNPQVEWACGRFSAVEALYKWDQRHRTTFCSFAIRPFGT